MSGVIVLACSAAAIYALLTMPDWLFEDDWIEFSVGRKPLPGGAGNPIWGILARNELGDILVPLNTFSGEPYWKDIFDRRNPWHWVPFLRSWVTRNVASIESCDIPGGGE